MRFVRELTGEIRTRLVRALTLEFRMDAAFSQQNLLKLLNRLGWFYAVKVPLCRWTGVKALSAAQARWTAVTGDIDCFETRRWVRTGRVGNSSGFGDEPVCDKPRPATAVPRPPAQAGCQNRRKP